MSQQNGIPPWMQQQNSTHHSYVPPYSPSQAPPQYPWYPSRQSQQPQSQFSPQMPPFMQQPPQQKVGGTLPSQKKKRLLWIFIGCLIGTALLALVSIIYYYIKYVRV